MLVVLLPHFRNIAQVKSFICQMWTVATAEKGINVVQLALRSQLGGECSLPLIKQLYPK